MRSVGSVLWCSRNRPLWRPTDRGNIEMDRCRLAFRSLSAASQPTTTFMSPSSIHHLHAELAVAAVRVHGSDPGTHSDRGLESGPALRPGFVYSGHGLVGTTTGTGTPSSLWPRTSRTPPPWSRGRAAGCRRSGSRRSRRTAAGSRWTAHSSSCVDDSSAAASADRCHYTAMRRALILHISSYHYC